MNDMEILNKLIAIQSNAYCEYSDFAVAAIVQSSNNNYYYGCNVENRAYPQGACAEGSAISAMVVNGEYLISDIYILGTKKSIQIELLDKPIKCFDLVAENNQIELTKHNFCTPCGGCRQAIKEFSNCDTKIHLFNGDHEKGIIPFDKLFPFAFSLDIG